MKFRKILVIPENTSNFPEINFNFPKIIIDNNMHFAEKYI